MKFDKILLKFKIILYQRTILIEQLIKIKSGLSPKLISFEHNLKAKAQILALKMLS